MEPMSALFVYKLKSADDGRQFAMIGAGDLADEIEHDPERGDGYPHKPPAKFEGFPELEANGVELFMNGGDFRVGLFHCPLELRVHLLYSGVEQVLDSFIWFDGHGRLPGRLFVRHIFPPEFTSSVVLFQGFYSSFSELVSWNGA